MKKLSILLILLLFLCIDAYSQKVAYAVLKDSTLTFYYNDKKPKGAYDVGNEIRTTHSSAYKEWDSKCNKIKTVIFDKSFKKYRPKSCSRWFAGCENLTSIIGIKENLNTCEVTRMDGMFTGCFNLASLDLSGFNTETVTDMGGMFWACYNLTTLDVSSFNTGNVTSMGYMFAGCINLKSLDLSGFNTEKVDWMNTMFWCCANLKTIYVGNNWCTSNIFESENMFRNCPNLIGGQGTKYNEYHIDAEYARIDGGESNPGYFTRKTLQNTDVK